MPDLYCLDTSGFLDGDVRHYPPDVFTTLWERMDEIGTSSRLIVPEEVYLELQYHHDDAFQWIDGRKDSLVMPTDARVIAAVRALLRDYPRLAMEGGNRNRADPFVIATAGVREAVVVTGERGGTVRGPKIPFVCAERGIDQVDFLQLVQREGWSF
jgi:hypothetical protein